MDEERKECFNLGTKLNRLIFESRPVDLVRIMMTSIPLKLVATKDAVYYADHKTKSLTPEELFDLKNNVNRAVMIFNTILAGRIPVYSSIR